MVQGNWGLWAGYRECARYWASWTVWWWSVGEDKVEIAHKEVHDAVSGGHARNREEAGKEAKEDIENGNQGFGCAREDK